MALTGLTGLEPTNINVTGIATFEQTVGIAGTLTYEDVTNVDSVGLITARNGINISGGNINVGTGVTIESNGQATFTGIVTASSFKGDGSNLTGIDATQIVTGNTSVQTVDTGSDGHIKFTTEGDERLRITSTGKFGINYAGNPPSEDVMICTAGQASPGGLSLSHLSGGNRYGARLQSISGTNKGLTISGIFNSSYTEVLRIDSNGRLLVSRSGLTASKNIGTKTGEIQVAAGGNNATISLINFENSAASPYLMLGKSRAGNTTGNTIVQADDRLGEIAFCGADGNEIDSFGAAIKAWVDGTPGNNNMPGRLVFYTTQSGQTASERMVIKSDGKIGIGRNDPVNFVDIARGQDEENILLVRGADNTTEYGALGIHSGNYVITGGGAGSTNTGIMFRTATSGNETNRLHITSSGNVEPATDNTYNFGSLTKRWANLYTADLNLSNEGSKNDVDGTWGQYTIQEGKDNLYLINKRSGKKYKFLLQEVS